MLNFNSKFYLFLMAIFITIATSKSDASEVSYEVKKNNGSVKFFAIGNPSSIRINGIGTGPEGKIEISVQDKLTKISGALDFDLNSLNSGIDMRDSHMKEKYLETEKFPISHLVLETIKIEENILKANTQKEAAIKGTLNLHGVAHTMEGHAVFNSTEDQLKVSAKFKIKSSDFKIEIPSFAGITVADDIEIEVEFNLAKTK